MIRLIQKILNLDNYSNNSPIGCSLEINIDYPDKVYNLHNYYHLEDYKIKVMEDLNLFKFRVTMQKYLQNIEI